MHRRSFLAVGSTAVIAPAAFCERAAGARTGRGAAPSVGVVLDAADPETPSRMGARRPGGLARGPACERLRIQAIAPAPSGASVSLQLVRDTVAGPVATTVWALSQSGVRSVAPPIAFETPRTRTMRFRAQVGSAEHEFEIDPPCADGRRSSVLSIPLGRGTGAPLWRFWRAEFDDAHGIVGVHRPMGLGSENDGRLLLAVSPCEREG